MLNLNSQNPLRGISTLAQTIALPHEHDAMRYPSFPALERTAVMAFNAPSTVNLASTSIKGILMRQAAYPLWVQQIPVAPILYSMVNDLIQPDPGGIFAPSPVLQWSVIPDPIGAGLNGSSSAAGPLATGSYATPNFNSALLAQDRGLGNQPFIWCPGTVNFTFSCAGGLADGTFDVVYELWVAPGEVTTNRASDTSVPPTTPVVISATNTGVTFSVPINGGWVRPRNVKLTFSSSFNPDEATLTTTAGAYNTLTYNTSTSNRGVFTATTPLSPVLLPAAYPTEFYNSTIPWNSARLTAVGVCFTNVTAALNKEGTVLAGRIAPSTRSVWTVTEPYIQSLHPSEKALLALADGFYTYCPPTTDMNTFYDYTMPMEAGTWGFHPLQGQVPVVRLDNDAMANVFFFSDPSTATATSLAVNLDWHVEFRTTSALFQLGLSALTLEVYHQTLITLMAHGYFFNNFDHIKMLRLLLKGGKAISSAFAPQGLKQAINYGLDYADKRLSNRPSPVPKTARIEIGNKPTSYTPRKQTTPPVRRGRAPAPPPARGRRGRGQSRQPAKTKPSSPPLPRKMQSGLDMYLRSKGLN